MRFIANALSTRKGAITFGAISLAGALLAAFLLHSFFDAFGFAYRSRLAAEYCNCLKILPEPLKDSNGDLFVVDKQLMLACQGKYASGTVYLAENTEFRNDLESGIDNKGRKLEQIDIKVINALLEKIAGGNEWISVCPSAGLIPAITDPGIAFPKISDKWKYVKPVSAPLDG